MLLYHGSNVEVRLPRIINTNRGLDFGSGFYTTSDLEQAGKWAISKSKRLRTGQPLVSVYEFDEPDVESKLLYKTFKKADREWLDFVSSNRKGEYKGIQYDIVCGPVANDRTILVVNDYLSGLYPAETAILLLETAKLSDQYTFLTEAGLERLHFKEVREYV